MKPFLLSAAVVLLCASSSAAQSAAGRWTISIDGGGQSAPTATSDRFEFQQNLESATVDVRYAGKADALFNGGLAIRVWHSLALGVSVSRFTHDGTAHVQAQIPHPFFFNRPRSIDYPFTVIQMKLDRDGTGKGTLSYATRITAKNNVIELEDFASQPIMLNNIKSEPKNATK